MHQVLPLAVMHGRACLHAAYCTWVHAGLVAQPLRSDMRGAGALRRSRCVHPLRRTGRQFLPGAAHVAVPDTHRVTIERLYPIF